jgi:hypothetical protein
MKRIREVLGIIGLLGAMVVLGTSMSKALAMAISRFW